MKNTLIVRHQRDDNTPHEVEANAMSNSMSMLLIYQRFSSPSQKPATDNNIAALNKTTR